MITQLDSSYITRKIFGIFKLSVEFPLYILTFLHSCLDRYWVTWKMQEACTRRLESAKSEYTLFIIHSCRHWPQQDITLVFTQPYGMMSRRNILFVTFQSELSWMTSYYQVQSTFAFRVKSHQNKQHHTICTLSSLFGYVHKMTFCYCLHALRQESLLLSW